jgi:tRNA-splicing ligase RtcB (3'-phosphate/5'-hydroxy nucleic acid ligase)
MRRTYPYEARTRELALAAGVDPDSRIDRPGQRSTLAWCAYREVAPKEHVAGEMRPALSSPPRRIVGPAHAQAVA